MNLWSLPTTEEEAVKFFQDRGLLPKERRCKNDHLMKLYFGKEIFWKCTLRACYQKINIRNGNWFAQSRLPFVTVARFIYIWAWEMTSGKLCKRELGINKDTTTDWSNYLRQACVETLLAKDQGQIGGEGMIVEIDESLFTKRKNNAGRVLPQQWIFGGICRETKECFLIEVPDRNAPTLLTAIKENIAEGTIIYSDSWKAYKTQELERAGFEHFKVNHRYNFVDPETGAHTQTVERMWGSAKWRNKKHRGTDRHFLKSYLAEFMWRSSIGEENPFDAILDEVKNRWPPAIGE